jgi:hypothetical protein
MTAPMSLQDQVTDLLTKHGNDHAKLRVNDAYYRSGYRPKAIGLAVPPQMKKLLAKIGWPRLYVDALTERLKVEGFRLASEASTDTKLWSWWQYNNLDKYSALAHTEALVHGRAYVTISAPDPTDPLARKDMPVIRVESAKDLYVDLDPRTQRVRRAIRPYKTKVSEHERCTLYLPNSTHFLVNGPQGWVEEAEPIVHDLGFVPVVPLVNQTRIEDTLGCSEITDEIRSATDAASRIMMDMAATAELMAIPQRVIFGLDEDEIAKVTGEKSFEAYIANILAFADTDGKIAQFAAAELRNFAEAMTMLRTDVASYTGLPPQYLSFTSDNPASADAIRASESRLVQKSEAKCVLMGEGWEQVMTIAMLVMKQDMPEDIHRLETVWRNPATPSQAAIADAVVKTVTAATPDGRPLVPVEQGRIDLGYSPEVRDQMEKWEKNSPRSRLADLYGQQAQAPRPAFSDTPQANSGPARPTAGGSNR